MKDIFVGRGSGRPDFDVVAPALPAAGLDAGLGLEAGVVGGDHLGGGQALDCGHEFRGHKEAEGLRRVGAAGQLRRAVHQLLGHDLVDADVINFGNLVLQHMQ